MSNPSTQNLNALVSPQQLQKLCKSISTLEAILCPEWEYRYYSYQKSWSDSEEFCEMRNGSGDQVLILFSKQCILINGFAHESVMNGWASGRQSIWKGVVDSVPEEFHTFVFGEPIKSIGTTFCIWATPQDETWQIGEISFPKGPYLDGSEDLLTLLDGNPMTYWKWATEYYELDFLSIKIIEDLYEGRVLTPKMVRYLNPNLKDEYKLRKDLEEIGYEHAFE